MKWYDSVQEKLRLEGNSHMFVNTTWLNTNASSVQAFFREVKHGQIWSYIDCHMKLMRQKQVSQAGISDYFPQFTAGCNYLSLPEIPVSGAKVLIVMAGWGSVSSTTMLKLGN